MVISSSFSYFIPRWIANISCISLKNRKKLVGMDVRYKNDVIVSTHRKYGVLLTIMKTTINNYWQFEIALKAWRKTGNKVNFSISIRVRAVVYLQQKPPSHLYAVQLMQLSNYKCFNKSLSEL